MRISEASLKQGASSAVMRAWNQILNHYSNEYILIVEPIEGASTHVCMKGAMTCLNTPGALLPFTITQA